MSRGVLLGTLSADGSLSLDVAAYHGSLWSLFIGGTTFGTGTLAFEGGDGTDFEPIMLTDDADASHVALEAVTTLGLYTFEAMCEVLRFTLAGATTPNLVLTMYPEQKA